MKIYEGKLLIGGNWVKPASNKIEEVMSPFDGEVAGVAAVASISDVEAAISAAVIGADIWRRTPAHQRSAILMRAAALADERVEEIAQIISSENGKKSRKSEKFLDEDRKLQDMKEIEHKVLDEFSI